MVGVSIPAAGLKVEPDPEKKPNDQGKGGPKVNPDAASTRQPEQRPLLLLLGGDWLTGDDHVFFEVSRRSFSSPHRNVGLGDANVNTDRHHIRKMQVLRFLVASDQDLEFRFTFDLALHPGVQLLLGHLRAHHEVGSVLTDVDLDETAA